MEQKKTTAIIGATTNPSRYASMAANMLTEYGHPIVPLGIKKGTVQGKEILDIRERPPVGEVDTLTLYVGEQNLQEHHDYLLSLKPKRIIFNPGAENDALYAAAEAQGIEAVEACTLVMLRAQQF